MEEVVKQGGQVAKEKVRSDAREKEAQARAEAQIAREQERTEAAKARAEADLAREKERTAAAQARAESEVTKATDPSRCRCDARANACRD